MRYQVMQGDCLALLPGLADGSVDAVITDPPYASGAHISAQRGKRDAFTPNSVRVRPVIEADSMGPMGFEWVTRHWFLAMKRIVKPGGHLLCFTDWRMYPQLSMLMEAGGWRLNNMIVWDKGYPGLGAGFRAQHEIAIAGSNGPPEWYSYAFGNVIRDMRLTKTEHPHEKPLSLLQAMITTCTPDDGTVIDPFMGSGTTGIACMRTGRKFIGIEIAPAYYAIAAKRIADAAAQPRLIPEAAPITHAMPELFAQAAD